VKIRSIALGLDIDWPLPLDRIARACAVLQAAARRFADAGFEVQTTRLVTQPFAEIGSHDAAGWVLPMARELDAACLDGGVEFVSVGPVRWSRLPAARAREYARAIPDVIMGTAHVSASIETAAEGRVFGAAARAGGEIVARLARETALGFGNFRFCTTAECPPNIPFFPAAYHGGGVPRLTIGLETADVVRQAFDGPGTLDDLERRLRESFGEKLGAIEAIARALCAEQHVEYGGTDLTPAPFPTDGASAAGMLEDLGVAAFGAAGTLSAAAAFTGMLKRLPFERVGYSGLMLPVLEDSVLAARTTDMALTWSELLLYSAVCGTGLDTVPLPGDAAPAELAALMLDVASLAATLRKPLSCRLFPVPGKRAGDLTEYDFPYFANAQVLSLAGRTSPRLFERFGA